MHPPSGCPDHSFGSILTSPLTRLGHVLLFPWAVGFLLASPLDVFELSLHGQCLSDLPVCSCGLWRFLHHAFQLKPTRVHCLSIYLMFWHRFPSISSYLHISFCGCSHPSSLTHLLGRLSHLDTWLLQIPSYLLQTGSLITALALTLKLQPCRQAPAHHLVPPVMLMVTERDLSQSQPHNVPVPRLRQSTNEGAWSLNMYFYNL